MTTGGNTMREKQERKTLKTRLMDNITQNRTLSLRGGLLFMLFGCIGIFIVFVFFAKIPVAPSLVMSLFVAFFSAVASTVKSRAKERGRREGREWAEKWLEKRNAKKKK